MSAERNEPVRLEGLEPFATGGRRWCFVDPRDPDKCIKVNRTDDLRFGRTQRGLILPAKWRRPYDNNLDEHRQLSRLMRRIGEAKYDHLPRTYGFVETDLGEGLVMDLIRDEAGPISRTLRQMIVEGVDAASFMPAFEQLGAYLLRHRVMTRALLDHNIVGQDLGRDRGEARWRLVMIDGMGDPAWLRPGALVPAIDRRRIRRRIEIGRERLRKLAADPPARESWDPTRWSQGFLEHRGV